MVQSEERREKVKKLREFARTCRVAVVRDDAGRQQIGEMMQRIRRAKGHADTKRDAEAVFKLYEGTFAIQPVVAPVAALGASADTDTATSNRIRGRSFLLTYNWDYFGKALPDGTSALADAGSLWSLWLTWKRQQKKNLGVTRSTSTLEESLGSALVGRVHFHWKIDMREPVDHTTPDAFLFHGIRPDVRKPWQEEGCKTARGVSYSQACAFACLVNVGSSSQVSRKSFVVVTSHANEW